MTDIRDIFSILHDGTISAWSGDKNLLTLTVECAYLAERVDPSFDRFYVTLLLVKKMEFAPWTRSADQPATIKTDFTDIYRAELELLSADISEDSVVVACKQHDTAFDYSGGNLTINCQSIKIYDQDKRELTLDQLKVISEKLLERIA